MFPGVRYMTRGVEERRIGVGEPLKNYDTQPGTAVLEPALGGFMICHKYRRTVPDQGWDYVFR